ncbi:MAG: hypothetical protein E7184_00150 [Erysipelotrichaceae bacterium]|nr:hypothetical protein [Erysipelotrichaceae bacterium]
MTSKELEQEIKDLEMEYKILNQSDLAITDYITYARRHNQLFSKIDLQKRRLDKVTIEELKERNEKLEKAIEILKTKKVDIHLILFANNYGHYISLLDPWEDNLKEEEYNLLKEVFGCD